jgi:putative SOS response-associated peptidase YedK
MASKLIHARSETITEKPSFRNSAAKRRAIIPANGYYEWMKSEGGKKILYQTRNRCPYSMPFLEAIGGR